VRVEYEPLPPCADLLFAGKLEGNAGKDRSQRSNFLADAYTDAEVIAMFDAEVSPLREWLMMTWFVCYIVAKLAREYNIRALAASALSALGSPSP
jgi:hypothetical protein